MQLLTHVELESKTYYAAFSIEFESVAAVMWEVYRSIQKMVKKLFNKGENPFEAQSILQKVLYCYCKASCELSFFVF